MPTPTKMLIKRRKPKEWSDVWGQEIHIANFNAWLKRRDMPHLVMYGPNGTGKTSALDIYIDKLYPTPELREANCRVINASKQSDSGVGFINDIIDIDMRVLPVEAPFRMIVFEEAERISSQGQRSLKVAMDTKHDCRLVFITNFPGQMDKGILGEGARSDDMFFANPTPDERLNGIRHIHLLELEDEFTDMTDLDDFFRDLSLSSKTPRKCVMQLDKKLYGVISEGLDIEVTAKLIVNKIFNAKTDKVRLRTLWAALLEIYHNFQVEFPDNERILLKFMYSHAKTKYMKKHPMRVGELTKALAETDIPLQDGVNANLHFGKLLYRLAKAFGVK